jgi:murein DD-endopeptidase MepM/ murein hydrolase activator NlpD
MLTPAMVGVFDLPQTNATLSLGYGTVNQHTRFVLEETTQGLAVNFQPSLPSTSVPMLLFHQQDVYIVDAPGVLKPIPAGDYLIYFDTIQVFAQHAEDANALFSLGMLERFSPDLPISRSHPYLTAEAVIGQRQEHTLLIHYADDNRQSFISAAHQPRYQSQFIGQDFGNPASLQVLGWAKGVDLPEIVQRMFSIIPVDSNLPLPGERRTPLELWLPFDCHEDWFVSWGYHFSNHQNRYAVDFASSAGAGRSQGLPVRAAHAGTLYLKIFGYAGQYIDLGIAARVLHEDGITSTEYGHLDEGTFDLWNLSLDTLPVFEWIEVGEVSAGQVIGLVGKTGYATGAHIHFALWTYDQSIDRPAFNFLREVDFRMEIPASRRPDCGQYPPN